ncbi:M48 family metallopeptidase [Kordiimonas pumila]|uniref:M48 family metallopeptidase n=1 Tax=Kordiimonas pumila TaxID=2161677 RepID=A0ABV7D881_9PROT|nr:M48 family metallopeptidase [Kordiimonas pumila]
MIARITSILIFAMFVTGCVTTNEVTGRSQFITIPASQDEALGLQALNEVKDSNDHVQTSGAMVEKVRRIGQRIVKVSDNPSLNWEFIVIDEPVLNAWALPGGKVAVYSKMIENLTEAELAAVLGHECAHAILRHGAEQVSRSQVQQLAVVGLGAAAGLATEDEKTASLAVALGSLAAQGFVALPHSRDMELEADHVGTIYMAKAGYDPRNAVALWKKMSGLKEGGGSQPTFLSTHPSDGKRIERLESRMTEYLGYYKP